MPRRDPAGRTGGIACSASSLHSTAVADTVSTNQFKNGMHIELDGQAWRIVDFQHVKPGNGGAFVRSTLKGLGSGAVVARTLRSCETFARDSHEPNDVQ